MTRAPPRGVAWMQMDNKYNPIVTERSNFIHVKLFTTYVYRLYVHNIFKPL